MGPDDPRHGTYAGGRLHRQDAERVCDPCRLAESRYQNVLVLDRLQGTPRSLPALGTKRRIAALMTLGHSMTSIGAALGVTAQSVSNLVRRDLAYCRRSTVERVAELYDEWSMQLPAERTFAERKAATYARTIARKRGYAPPLAWDDIDTDEAPDYGGSDTDIDPVVVMRLLEGQRVKATKAEKEAAMTRWVADGAGSKNELARMHGWQQGRYSRHLRLVGEAS